MPRDTASTNTAPIICPQARRTPRARRTTSPACHLPTPRAPRTVVNVGNDGQVPNPLRRHGRVVVIDDGFAARGVGFGAAGWPLARGNHGHAACPTRDTTGSSSCRRRVHATARHAAAAVGSREGAPTHRRQGADKRRHVQRRAARHGRHPLGRHAPGNERQSAATRRSPAVAQQPPLRSRPAPPVQDDLPVACVAAAVNRRRWTASVCRRNRSRWRLGRRRGGPSAAPHPCRA